MKYILVVDEGTSHTRAVLFNMFGEIERIADEALTQYYPKPGWVEHCPEEIWQKTLMVIRRVCDGIDLSDIVSCGVTNQRETTILWNKKTGQCLGRAIVWQDQRTQELCDVFTPYQEDVYQRTGLKIVPYFSASKLTWMIENYQLSDFKDLAFGTIDSFLIWRLTGGAIHATDVTNASRTLLMNIHTQTWDEELLKLYRIPKEILPTILGCDDFYGEFSASILGRRIPIRGVMGDQQASLVGVGALAPGMAKVTYGTGGFVMNHTGQNIYLQNQGLLTTIAYRLQGQTHYALEGNIFDAASSLSWLKNQLNWIKSTEEMLEILQSIDSSEGTYFIPSFSGIGAPHWLKVHGAYFMGIHRQTMPAHMIRAVMESIAFQSRDILNLMTFDSLTIDGGMAHLSWFVEYLSTLIQKDIDIPKHFENTAKGVAWVAGHACGAVGDNHEWQKHQKMHFKSLNPKIEEVYEGWQGIMSRLKEQYG